MAEGRRPFNSSMIYPSQRSQTSFVKEPWCYPSLRRPSYLVRYLNSSVDAHRRNLTRAVVNRRPRRDSSRGDHTINTRLIPALSVPNQILQAEDELASITSSTVRPQPWAAHHSHRD